MLPKKLISRLNSFQSAKDFEQTMQGYSGERLCSFRVNTLKSNEAEIEAILNTKKIPFIKVPFLTGAYTIYREHEFTIK